MSWISFLSFARREVVTERSAILFDSHVHVHANADIAAIFSHARKNAAALGFGAVSLCIVDRSGDDGFSRASIALGQSSNDEVAIELIPGSQIVTKDRIEVLSLGHRLIGADGFSLTETMHRVWEEGGFPVIPWSAGKWLGARGRSIECFLREDSRMHYGLGDIPMRPRIFLDNRIFRYAREKGVPILAGSDPLPILGDEGVVCTYCSTVTFAVGSSGDGYPVVRALRDGNAEVRTIGVRQRMIPAVVRWVRLKCG